MMWGGECQCGGSEVVDVRVVRCRVVDMMVVDVRGRH